MREIELGVLFLPTGKLAIARAIALWYGWGWDARGGTSGSPMTSRRALECWRSQHGPGVSNAARNSALALFAWLGLLDSLQAGRNVNFRVNNSRARSGAARVTCGFAHPTSTSPTHARVTYATPQLPVSRFPAHHLSPLTHPPPFLHSIFTAAAAAAAAEFRVGVPYRGGAGAVQPAAGL